MYFLPNYKDGSIVNLMSSIKRYFGGKSPYGELKLLGSKELKGTKNVVLIVLDGLGYTFLEENGKDTILEKGLKGRMTSVFPGTTASAITSFNTGLAPMQHAFIGWNMFLREVGVVTTTLQFCPRCGGKPYSSFGIDFKEIFSCKRFTEGISVESYIIRPKVIVNSDFSKATSKNSKVFGYNSLRGFISTINKAVKSNNKKKYIYGYWHKYDSICHKKGSKSKEAKEHYLELCNGISLLLKNIKGTNTKLIITADHGFIDTKKEHFIDLKDHPVLYNCLTMPLCGDARVIYCYVHPHKAKMFEKYVKTKLKHYCLLYKSLDLVKKGLFGLFKPNPKLFDRIGDYILIMKEDYVLKESILGSKKGFKIGRHSGLSKEEMLVPLVVFDV